jgi:Lrp/AsnC family leucine-responsive transcriptional regulator
VQAFISVVLERHEVTAIQRFEEDVQKIPHVRACYHLTGRFDYLLHVAVADLNRLGELVKADIAAIPNVGKSETFLVLSEIKPDNGWPIADLIKEGFLKNQERK